METPINKAINKERIKFNYRYDFGDGWEHTLVVEKILEKSSEKCPICIGKKGACPPEDCGGIAGYERFLKILKTGKDPWGKNVAKLKNWLGNWNPEKFDMNKINKKLKKLTR